MRDPITRERSRARDAAYKRATRAFFSQGQTAENPYPLVGRRVDHCAFEDRMFDLILLRNLAGTVGDYARDLHREGKPHLGRIANWTRYHLPAFGHDIIVGTFLDHPQWPGKRGHTSWIVSMEGDEIETRNSRYRLVEDAALEAYVDAILETV